MNATCGTYAGNKYYALLGRLLTKAHPEVAKNLIATYVPTEAPKESDYSRIGVYFIAYCKLQGINPADYTGPLYKSSKVELRRLFIAVILHLYTPQSYYQPLDGIILSNGLVKTLCEVLGCGRSWISETARKVITWEKSYEDFSERVQGALEEISHEDSVRILT